MTPSMKQSSHFWGVRSTKNAGLRSWLGLLVTQVLQRISELAVDPQEVLFGAVSLWVGFETSRYLGRGTVCGALAHTSAILAILRLVRRSQELLNDEEEDPSEEGDDEQKKSSCCRGSCCPKEVVIQEQQETCCICLEDLDHRSSCRGQLRRLECGHVFHRRCVNEWLKTRPVCPLCKDGEQKASANNNSRRRTSERQRQQSNPDAPRSGSGPNRAEPRETQIRLTVAALYMMVHHPIEADPNNNSEEKQPAGAEAPQEEAGAARPPWARTFNSRSSARLPLLPIPNENPPLIQAAA